MPKLQVLELQACSPNVAPWPGVLISGSAVFPAGPLLDAHGDAIPHGGLHQAAGPGADFGLDAGLESESQGSSIPVSESNNLFAGLSCSQTLKEIIIHDSSSVLVRHLAVASLPGLKVLRLERLNSSLR